MDNPYALYLVTDTEICPRKKLCQTVENAILGGVTMVQLREKDLDSRTFYQEALALKEITSRYGIPLLINDRLDIALAIDADGLHIGQSDLPVAVVRRILGPDKLLGVSVDTLAQAETAKRAGADYFGVGAVFPTTTKDDASYVGIQIPGEIRRALNLPVVGIGGISKETLPLLYGSGIDGIAVVSAIMASSDPQAASKILREMVKNL